MLKNLDLFSGIGGFSYVFHEKIKTIGYCDTSNRSKKVLRCLINKNLIDDAPIFHDVSALDQTDFSDIPDMISGGFPCQDISHANRTGVGLAGKRSSLFYEIIRLCDEIPNVKHVFLENVSRIVANDILDTIEKSFSTRGFQVKHIVLTAKQFGAPHTRRRCFIIATKDMDTLKTVRLNWEDRWGETPENMVRVGSETEKNEMKHRCCLCGNSVVPACVSSAFNHMVHGDPLPGLNNPMGIIMRSGDTVFRKPRWGTPYASFNIYKPYKLESLRSSGVLFNQIWYSVGNEDKRTDEWTVNPVFVEWMMGYPEDYTKA
jgi:hypothetical protein